MGTGRTLNKNPRTRPIKTPGVKARRLKAQRSRLLKLGLEEAVVDQMTPETIRKTAMNPDSVKKSLAIAAAKKAETAVAE